ncbi:MAG: hypothetical protein QOF48_2555 [Verrucomicrobiota bacterium]|jgi:hypothetical protein
MKLPLLLQIAGLLHLVLLCAGATMPHAVKMRENLVSLPPFLRRLFLVYYGFIAMLIAGFGCITFFNASELAAGGPLAKALCGFLILFWGARLAVAAFVFDVRPYLTSLLLRVGYQVTNLVFIYLLAVYVLVFWKGGTP